MTTINTVTDRVDGEVLTAAKYNADHAVHEGNATNLNNDKVETSVFEVGHSAGGTHDADVLKQEMNLTSQDAVSFLSVTASGDRSTFGEVHLLGPLVTTSDIVSNSKDIDVGKGKIATEHITASQDILVAKGIRTLGKIIGTGDINEFASADFLGVVTVDSLAPRRSAPSIPQPDQIYRDSVINAFIRMDVGAGVNIKDDFNVAAAADIGVGQAQISFATSLDTSNYAFVGTSGQSAFVHGGAFTVGKFDVVLRDDAGAVIDRNDVSVIIAGGMT